MLGNNRKHYLQSLEELKTSLLDLYSRVSKSFSLSLQSLQSGNLILCGQIIQKDKIINANRQTLEEEALRVLALQQPVLARDLRLVTAIYLFAGELERIADYAVVIARITNDLYTEGDFNTFERIVLNRLVKMGNIGLELLDKAIDCFIRLDVETARSVAKEDDILDLEFNGVSSDILSGNLNGEISLARVLTLSRVAHNIERVGDRAVNICERVVFVQSGELADF